MLENRGISVRNLHVDGMKTSSFISWTIGSIDFIIYQLEYIKRNTWSNAYGTSMKFIASCLQKWGVFIIELKPTDLINEKKKNKTLKVRSIFKYYKQLPVFSGYSLLTKVSSFIFFPKNNFRSGIYLEKSRQEGTAPKDKVVPSICQASPNVNDLRVRLKIKMNMILKE